jgi:hypothetical protein
LGREAYIVRERHDFERWVYPKRENRTTPVLDPDIPRHYITSYLNTCNCFTQTYKYYHEKLTPHYTHPSDTLSLLSIIVLNNPERIEFNAQRLLDFQRQGSGHRFELLQETPGDWSQRELKNHWVTKAQGAFVCFLDTEDWPGFDYASSVIEAIRHNPQVDLIVFDGLETEDSLEHTLHISGLEYEEREKTGVQFHPPSPRMCWRRGILEACPFREDESLTEWSRRAMELVRDQVRINKVLSYRNTFRNAAFIAENRKFIESYRYYTRFSQLIR